MFFHNLRHHFPFVRLQQTVYRDESISLILLRYNLVLQHGPVLRDSSLSPPSQTFQHFVTEFVHLFPQLPERWRIYRRLCDVDYFVEFAFKIPEIIDVSVRRVAA